MGKHQTDQAIDFVITWVDGNDPEWRRRKAHYTGTELEDDREIRYRDWGLLRYWFRGVEQFAPWVHWIFFVCDQEPPEWLNLNHPKLRIIRHEDYIPERFLPTFNSHTIEHNLHRIKELAEHFVYFNDDMFLIAPVQKRQFFKNGLPRDAALLNPIPTTDLKNKPNGKIFTIPLNNTEYLNRDYDFRACVKAHLTKWVHPFYGKSSLRNLVFLVWPRFIGFYEHHLPQPFLKSSFEKAWQQDQDILETTCAHRVRNDQDISPWLIRQRQMAEGEFAPARPLKDAVFDLDSQAVKAAEMISRQKSPMVCLNDDEINERDFVKTQEMILTAFNSILSAKSSFEMK